MAARFTKGDSIASTSSIKSENRGGKDVRTSSMKLKGGSTMPGMPGSIRTGADTSGAATAKRGKGGAMTMKQGGPGSIGKRGGSGPFPKSATGTMGKNTVVTPGRRGTMESLRGATAGATMSRGKGKSVMY